MGSSTSGNDRLGFGTALLLLGLCCVVGSAKWSALCFVDNGTENDIRRGLWCILNTSRSPARSLLDTFRQEGELTLSNLKLGPE